ncbi:histone-lysine N-methyltransferase SETMAR [Trichonephila clavipes]|nr:histone-lysine N-methyltransferase SETMAR [Trichonephila clavipes]
MFKVIESPAKYEIRSVILFLTARNMSAADIHRQITEVYGTEAMSNSKTTHTAEHKEKRFAISLDFLIRYEEEGEDMLSRIVTGDENGYMISLRKSNSRWNSDTSPPVKVKAKQTMSKRKIMVTAFWGRRGVLLRDFMPKGTIINSGAYCATLRKLRRALQSKRRGMLSKCVFLL